MTSSAPAPAPTATPPRSRHRAELHGLRGLAIALVVLYHVWFDRVSGGVDVFLFLSAFFLTGTFLRRLESGTPAAPAAYWARTFKRLLPPAVIVVIGTLAGVRLFLPPSTWMPAIHDAIGSLAQVQNWVLIHRGTDYEAAATTATSPLQHFWSMSIQGQVFLLWPVLFALCAVLARRARIAPRRVVLVVLAVIAVGSFAWSVVSTVTQQEIAYFDTFARLWEFAAGSLLALLPAAVSQAAPGTARGRRLRVALGWAGLVILIGTGALLDARSLFPGWIAVVPLLGAALVIVTGATGSALGADRLLRTRPFSLLGDISYALYLVHWPILTIMLLATGRDSAGLLRGAAVIAVSLLLAYALTRLVDAPIRRWRWANESAWRQAAVVGLAALIGLSPVLGAQQQLHRAAEAATLRAVADNPGARVLDPEYTPHPDADPQAPPIPSGATLRQDWSQLEEPCTGALEPADDIAAESCRMTAADEDAPVIVAVGNSRVGQTAMSLAEPAREHGWRLVILWQPSCVFTPGIDSYKGAECDAFNDSVLEYLQELRPEAVAVGTTQLTKDPDERTGKVLDETVPSLLDQGSDVIALRDTPRVERDPVTCLEEGGDVEECTQALDPALMAPDRPDADVLARLAETSSGATIHPIDLTMSICPDYSCPPLIGNVHVMFDVDHLSATYAESLGDETDRQLTETGFRW